MDRFVREVQKSRLDSEVRAALVSSPCESQELFQKAGRARWTDATSWRHPKAVAGGAHPSTKRALRGLTLEVWRDSAHSPRNGRQLREVPIPCSPAVALRTCSAARSPRRFPGPPVVAFVARFFERGSTTQLDRRSSVARQSSTISVDSRVCVR